MSCDHKTSRQEQLYIAGHARSDVATTEHAARSKIPVVLQSDIAGTAEFGEVPYPYEVLYMTKMRKMLQS